MMPGLLLAAVVLRDLDGRRGSPEELFLGGRAISIGSFVELRYDLVLVPTPPLPREKIPPPPALLPSVLFSLTVLPVSITGPLEEIPPPPALLPTVLFLVTVL